MNSKTRNRLLVLVALVPLAVALLILLFLVEERLRGKSNLASFRKALVTKGEKTAPGDLAAHTALGLNGAPLLAEAVQQLQTNEASLHYPSPMRLLDSGEAVAAFRGKEWVEDETTYGWEQLAQALEQDAKGLELARKALEQPSFDNRLDYSQGAKLLLPHLQSGRTLARRFGLRAQLALHRGSTAEAIEDLVAEVRMIRVFENDQLLISELVRAAIAGIARSHTWEALQAENWADQDLARLALAWQESQFIAPMARAMVGERIYAASTFDRMRASNAETVTVLYWMEDSGYNLGLSDEEPTGWWYEDGALQRAAKSLRNQVYVRTWRFAWIDQNQARYEQQIQRLAELLRETVRHQSYQTANDEVARVNESSKPRNLYDRIRMPGHKWLSSVSGGMLRCMRMQTERSLVLSAIALKRHQLRVGRYPESLDALVPEYLESAPVDYMDGQSLRYRLKPDGSFLLYSVGEDGEDSSGDVSQDPNKPKLRNIWNRKDVVWPEEARG